jgi:single-strand DNA-binding protein
MNLNKVIIAGNLTRDPEIRYTPAGLAIAKFSVAINRSVAGQGGAERRNEVTYVDVDSFGKQAEYVGKTFRKGKSIFVEGRLQFQMWDDKATGAKKTKLSIIAENVQSPIPTGTTANAQETDAPAPAAPAAAPAATNQEPAAGDDVPF